MRIGMNNVFVEATFDEGCIQQYTTKLLYDDGKCRDLPTFHLAGLEEDNTPVQDWVERAIWERAP